MHNGTLMLVATVVVGAVVCTACNGSLPAFETAMVAHTDEVAEIAGNAADPSFANTIEVLERSGELLERTNLVFINLNEAHSSEGLQELAREINPRLSDHQDDILLNEELFKRVKAVYDSRDEIELTTEQDRPSRTVCSTRPTRPSCEAAQTSMRRPRHACARSTASLHCSPPSLAKTC